MGDGISGEVENFSKSNKWGCEVGYALSGVSGDVGNFFSKSNKQADWNKWGVWKNLWSC